MTKLRDWQKRASERRDHAANTYAEHVLEAGYGSFIDGYISRDAEIDLLLQIIEKQSEKIQSCLSCYGCCYEAKDTQAEVQGLVEKLMGEK